MIASPLGYFGRKGNLAPFLFPHFPSHRVYVEPFCGSCSLLMKKPRTEREIVSDIDGELINFLTQLRDKWYVLKPMCLYDYKFDTFQRARRNLNAADPLEAARFYFAANRQALRNYPHTSTWEPFKQQTFNSALQSFSTFAARLESVEIHRMHYRSALLLYGDHPDAFSYCDPPYLFPEQPESNRQRYEASRVYRFDMGEAEKHLELLRVLKCLRGKVMISGYPSRLYERELAGWRVKRTEVTSIQPVKQYRRKRMEVIWMNY